MKMSTASRTMTETTGTGAFHYLFVPLSHTLPGQTLQAPMC